MKPSYKILIIDDDKELGQSLVDLFQFKGYQAEWVGSGTEALLHVRDHSYSLALLDLLLPGMDGMQILSNLMDNHPSMVVVMMSGHGNIQTAVRATHLGAYDWLEKPLEKDRLLLTVKNALEKSELVREKEILLSQVKERFQMVGVSRAIKEICGLIDKVAGQDITVLITGESGTGKELVARAIHNNSLRASKKFVEVNCAAVPETLIESELYGHTKGAFTNAVCEKDGKFQTADGGTLFMDEIGDLSLHAQAKVLRSIEIGEVEKVGSNTTEKVDVRLISATNKSLSDMVGDKSFREDLFHRINVIEIHVPPLRERLEDVLPLAGFFMEKFCGQKKIPVKKITTHAESILISYAWPGNVRELRNFVEKISVLVDTQEVTAAQVSKLLNMPDIQEPVKGNKTFRIAKENFEKTFIIENLMHYDWNVTETAERINMPRSVLYKKIQKYNLSRPSPEADD